MAQVALRDRHGIENRVKLCLGSIRIAFLKQRETHGYIATIAALGAAEALTIIDVIVVNHEADFHAFQRIEHLAQRTSQHVEESIRTGRAHVALGNQRIAITVITRRRSEVRPVVE